MCEVADYLFDAKRNDLAYVLFTNGVRITMEGLSAIIEYGGECHTTYRHDPRGRLRNAHNPLLSLDLVWRLLSVARNLTCRLQQQNNK